MREAPIRSFARAAELAGDRAAARGHYTRLAEVMRAADPGRPEPRMAREFLARN